MQKREKEELTRESLVSGLRALADWYETTAAALIEVPSSLLLTEEVPF